MYSLNMPVARLRAKMREEFEKHRYVNNLQAVDVLIAQSHMEFQVRPFPASWTTFFGHRTGNWTDEIIGIGNTQLLETAVTRHEVLQKGGRSERTSAEKLHRGVFGGLSALYPSCLHWPSLTRESRDEIETMCFFQSTPVHAVHRYLRHIEHHAPFIAMHKNNPIMHTL